ncbi:MAG: hypothetical protein RLZZ306_1831 [Bacteroidota bacterium]|jgi:heme/copper-type cytochrome/quinol oxidase subunit 4
MLETIKNIIINLLLGVLLTILIICVFFHFDSNGNSYWYIIHFIRKIFWGNESHIAAHGEDDEGGIQVYQIIVEIILPIIFVLSTVIIIIFRKVFKKIKSGKIQNY